MSTAAQPDTTPAPSRRRGRMNPETQSQIQSLAQRLQAMLEDQPKRGHVVGVTSCDRREGVSVVASNLTICASEVYRGRVLLIDANPRNASVASRFGVRPSPGLADCFSGELAVNECIASTSNPNLFILPAGSGHSQHSAGGREAARVIETLRNDFD